MSQIPLINEFLKKQDSKIKITWLALTSTGSHVKDEFGHTPPAWLLKNGDPILNGYSASRIVRGNDGVFKVDLNIEKTGLGQPIFRATAFKVDIDGNISSIPSANRSSLSSTPVSNEILNDLKVETGKKWPGPKFFGLDRKDVLEILKSDSVKNQHKKRKNLTDREETVSEVKAPEIASYNLKGLLGLGRYWGYENVLVQKPQKT